MTSEPKVPKAPFLPTSSELKARKNIFKQAFRFIAINLKMIDIIRKDHH
ncbi:MAG: hypothetical protein RLZZ330_395 [Actinomycetota bacterium]|jgi:hypothetical protein